MYTKILADTAKNIKKLVENKTTFGGIDTKFCVYDTYKQVHNVVLKSQHLLLFAMVQGKKVLRIGENGNAFDFTPNETIILAANQEIWIDFPNASLETPTKCITLEISERKIDEIIENLNRFYPLPKASDENLAAWKRNVAGFLHFSNNSEMNGILKKLVLLFGKDSKHKEFRDVMTDNYSLELLLKLLQTDKHRFILDNYQVENLNSGLRYAVEYIRKNIESKIHIDLLAQKAHMSNANFFRHFKKEFGVSPLKYINRLKYVRACKLLERSNKSVTDVCYGLGFNSQSHFIKMFKRHSGITPKCFQLQNDAQKIDLANHDKRPDITL